MRRRRAGVLLLGATRRGLGRGRACGRSRGRGKRMKQTHGPRVRMGGSLWPGSMVALRRARGLEGLGEG